MKGHLCDLEEKHDIFKHHTGDELMEINKTFCEIKEVFSRKPNEEDIKLITANMDLLFNMIKKEMRLKDAGNNLLYLHRYLYICGFLGASVFRFYI